MHQSIEQQRETIDGRTVITVMPRDRAGILALFDSYSACESGAPSLSACLTAASAVCASRALLYPLDAYELTDFSRHRTRRRAMRSIKKFSAEELIACSALVVSAANWYKRGTQAADNETATMIGQCRCDAA